MKHRSRVEREEGEDAERTKLEGQNKGDRERLAEVKERLAEEEEEEDKEVRGGRGEGEVSRAL